ncbi:LAGLIDADG family homing endonuclease [Blastopirellula sp. JC733]|nr:LAGLIDADG family homing endonuclease [Blastopirellula sediminis]
MIVEKTSERKNGRYLYLCKCVYCEREFKAVPKEVRADRWICGCMRGRRTARIHHVGNALDSTELYYLAGFFDGEGYIGIQKVSRSDRANRVSYQARAIIGHTSVELLNKLREMTGLGKIFFHGPETDRRKESHQLSWTPNDLRALLPQLLPCLYLKRQQAELVSKYLSFAGQVNHKDAVAVAEYNAKCEEIYDQVSILNRRGESKEPAIAHFPVVPLEEKKWLAYLAGLIDGEGTLTIRKSHRAHRQGRVTYNAMATIPSTNYSLLNRIMGWTGGVIREKLKRSDNHKQCFELHLGPTELRQILPGLKPLLLLKQSQAKLLMEHLEVAGHFNRKDPNAVADYMSGREEVYQQLKKLNKRGT